MFGFWMCIALVPVFAGLALLFACMKERAAGLLAGFNELPAQEQLAYDRTRIARDNRDCYLLSAAAMLAGAIGSLLLSGLFAVAAYAIWLFLQFRCFHWDARRAYAKYKL
ncbi:MAG: DUF3784 domain-containing protein [Christensenellaceae bacterium]|nr:DUF3784 domain-containing protein [Christensenellaceae bacterium]